MLAFLHVLEDLSDLVKCLRFENIAKLLVLNDSSDSRKCCDLRICCFALKRFEKVKVIYAIKFGKTQITSVLEGFRTNQVHHSNRLGETDSNSNFNVYLKNLMQH